MKLAGGWPVTLGFTVSASIDQAGDGGVIPFPADNEDIDDGHAVATIGYDEHKEITRIIDDVRVTATFLVRYSWEPGWGDEGYGWLAGAVYLLS